MLLLVAATVACGSPQTVPTPEPTPLPTPTAVVATLPPAAKSQPTELTATQTLPSVADVVDKINPWVASITVESIVRGFFYDYPNQGAGSGFIVQPNGYIVTNDHVIDGAKDIKVHLPNGVSYDAQVVGRDDVTDLAVIKIEAEDLPTATFADSDDLRVGDWVMTIGNALALKGGPTVTLGIVSALGRTINTDQGPFYNLIQTDAAINDGNSGGPLVNMNGEVVGINQVIVRDAQGMGFAVSAAGAVPIIDSLIEHGRVIRPKIGFNGQDVTPAIADELDLDITEGVLVTQMQRGTPAYEAGIRVGDVVTKIDDIPTPDVPTWLNLLWSYQVGGVVNVEYIHNDEVLTTMVKLAERAP